MLGRPFRLNSFSDIDSCLEEYARKLDASRNRKLVFPMRRG
jgi:hypothetical protein